MPQTQTELILKAKTQGFSEASNESDKLGRKTAAATKAAAVEVKRLEQQLRRLSQEQTRVNKALDGTEKGTKAYADLGKELQSVEKSTGRVEKNIRALERAYKDAGQEAKKGSFTQGFLQGAVPSAAFIQRGPGAMRQAGGVAAGRMGRGVAGGIGQIPFQGASGIAQALQSIPGGGILAQPLMQAMQRAQQALQFRQQKQELTPFLQMGQETGGTVAQGESSKQQRARITARYDQHKNLETVSEPISGLVTGNRSLLGEVGRLGELASSAKDKLFPTLAHRSGAARAAKLAKMSAPFGGIEGYAGEQQRLSRDASIDAAIKKEGVHKRTTRVKTLQDLIRSQGQKFGYALPEATGIMGGISRAGGGTGQELAGQGMVPMGMAASRMGLGPEVGGAFLQGGRRGGVVGGLGRSGDAFGDAIKEGMSMGLEGSELNEWMQQMAGDIRQWRTSGIPINTKSVSAIGTSLGKSGIGGLRGGAMAQGITSRARDLSTRGPQSSAELVMMQELGGWKGGGGVEALEEAQLKMQEGTFTPEDVQRMSGRFMGAGGGGAGGRAVFRQAMGGMGIKVGIRESRLLQKQAQGGDLSKDEKIALAEATDKISRGAKKAGAFSPEAMAKMTDPALRRQAATTNQQIATGQTMIKSMQALEKATSNIVLGFTDLAAGPLTNFTKGIAGLSDEIPGLTRRLRSLVGGDVAGLLVSGAQ